jgi:hypothetical protein
MCSRPRASRRGLRGDGVVWLSPVVVSAVMAACAAASGSPQPSPRVESWTDGGGRAPSFEPGAAASDSPLENDPLWQRAARGDVIDLARLADREGAAGLLAGVEQGGRVGLTALAALPYAEDAEIALGPLCALAARMPAERVGPVLVALEGILGRPVLPTERLDAEGLLSCRAGLPRLESSAGLAPADRDRVGNSRALLEEWLNGR